MMNKLILAISLTIVLVLACFYFVRNRSTVPLSRTITSFEECVRAGNRVGESYPRQCWTQDGSRFVENIKQDPIPNVDSVKVTVSGEMTCLPKTGTGAQTMECAMGLKSVDGNFYGLKNLSKFDPDNKFSVGGVKVEVTGLLSRVELKGPDGNNYAVVGVIDLTSIVQITSDSGRPGTPNILTYKTVQDLLESTSNPGTKSVVGTLVTGDIAQREFCTQGIYIQDSTGALMLRKPASGSQEQNLLFSDKTLLGKRVKVTGLYPAQDVACEALICDCENYILVDSVIAE
jgi:hypothetical protein